MKLTLSALALLVICQLGVAKVLDTKTASMTADDVLEVSDFTKYSKSELIQFRVVLTAEIMNVTSALHQSQDEREQALAHAKLANLKSSLVLLAWAAKQPHPREPREEGLPFPGARIQY